MIHRTALMIGVCLLAGGFSAVRAATGVAHMHPTGESRATGTVTFADTADGLKVAADLRDVPPGRHGFHIHEFGLCGDAGKAAGEHYNPAEAEHGLVTREGPREAHAGDLGNIEADARGEATLEAVIPGVSLADGPRSVAGRAVILHEKADDFSQPSGDAGGRIACGQILIRGD